MSLDQIIKQRRSIRKYKKKPVSNEQIQLLIQAAVEAPSWKNSQTARYHVITSQPLLNEFKERCLPEFNQENCKDAPVLIVTSFIPNRSGKATELGLGSLVMGIRDIDKIKGLLDISKEEIIVSVIAIGISDIEPERPKRKTVEDITRFY